jgi:hypothetical protein
VITVFAYDTCYGNKRWGVMVEKKWGPAEVIRGFRTEAGAEKRALDEHRDMQDAELDRLDRVPIG